MRTSQRREAMPLPFCQRRIAIPYKVKKIYSRSVARKSHLGLPPPGMPKRKFCLVRTKIALNYDSAGPKRNTFFGNQAKGVVYGSHTKVICAIVPSLNN